VGPTERQVVAVRVVVQQVAGLPEMPILAAAAVQTIRHRKPEAQARTRLPLEMAPEIRMAHRVAVVEQHRVELAEKPLLEAMAALDKSGMLLTALAVAVVVAAARLWALAEMAGLVDCMAAVVALVGSGQRMD
jgi:hypothetical protein